MNRDLVIWLLVGAGVVWLVWSRQRRTGSPEAGGGGGHDSPAGNTGPGSNGGGFLPGEPDPSEPIVAPFEDWLDSDTPFLEL